MLYTILVQISTKHNLACVLSLTSRSYTQDKYYPTIKNQNHIVTFSHSLTEETNPLSGKCIDYICYLHVWISLCVYVYIIHTSMYFIFNKIEYLFFPPEILSTFIIKVCILINKFLLKRGALVRALTFFIV